MKLPVTKVDQINHAEAGRMIREFRTGKGYSLRWLAGKLGFSAPFVSDLERGNRNWTEETFYKAVHVIRHSTNTSDI